MVGGAGALTGPRPCASRVKFEPPNWLGVDGSALKERGKHWPIKNAAPKPAPSKRVWSEFFIVEGI